jgi:hypothetical protein
VNRNPRIVVEDLKPFQAKVLKVIGYLVGIKGNPFIAFIQYEKEEMEPSINDIAKNNAEDDANSVRNNN